LIARQTGIVIGRGVHKELDEGTLDHLKKMKGIETLSNDAQFMLDMKKARGASKDDFILQQHPKGPDEGSGMIPEAPDVPSGSSGSSSSKSKDEEGFVSIDDEATQEKADDEKAIDVKDADEQVVE
ncbi:hypothetical protein Tco_0479875, partial [Tanacetum coccineum]